MNYECMCHIIYDGAYRCREERVNERVGAGKRERELNYEFISANSFMRYKDAERRERERVKT